FTSTGNNTFMHEASLLPALPPIAFDSILQDGAIAHNSWMYSYFYTHSVFSAGQAPPPGESPGAAIPGIPRNFNPGAGDYFNWTGAGLDMAGENIAYAYNVLPTLLKAYENGQVSITGYYERLVYADLIGYVLEYDNGD